MKAPRAVCGQSTSGCFETRGTSSSNDDFRTAKDQRPNDALDFDAASRRRYDGERMGNAASGRHPYGADEPQALLELAIRQANKIGLKKVDGKWLISTLTKKASEAALALLSSEPAWHTDTEAAHLVSDAEGGEQPLVAVTIEVGILDSDAQERSGEKCRAINRVPLSGFMHKLLDTGKAWLSLSVRAYKKVIGALEPELAEFFRLGQPFELEFKDLDRMKMGQVNRFSTVSPWSRQPATARLSLRYQYRVTDDVIPLNPLGPLTERGHPGAIARPGVS